MTPGIHRVLGTPIAGPWPEGTKTAIFGLGCFWGDEKDFWQLPGVVTTAVGYAGGYTPEPDLRRGLQRPDRPRRGGLVAYDPARISYEQLLKTFWEATTRPRACARATTGHPVPVDHPGRRRRAAGRRRGLEGDVPGASVRQRATARSRPRSRTPVPFYYAEDYHQQYLDKKAKEGEYGYCPDHPDRREAPGRLRGHPAPVRRLAPLAEWRETGTERQRRRRRRPARGVLGGRSGAGITLEQDYKDVPFAITCGIYGWMVHSGSLARLTLPKQRPRK